MKLSPLFTFAHAVRLASLLVLALPPVAAFSQTVNTVSENAAGTQITITGINFGSVKPTLHLGAPALTVLGSTATSIVAQLPSGVAPGSYPLSVLNNSTQHATLFDVTLGSAGPVGPQGVAGPAGVKGATGQAGVPGAPGPEGVQGSKGAQGPQGVAGSSAGMTLTGNTTLQGGSGQNGYFGALSGVVTSTRDALYRPVQQFLPSSCKSASLTVTAIGAYGQTQADINVAYAADSSSGAPDPVSGDQTNITASCTLYVAAGQRVGSCTTGSFQVDPTVPYFFTIVNANYLADFADSNLLSKLTCQ